MGERSNGSTQALRCWLLSDGAAGNIGQARALAQALAGAAIPPQQETVLRTLPPWRWLAPRLLPSSARAFGGDFAARAEAPAPLAIGCGRQAALATRWLRRAHGARCRTVQILDPRIDPGAFDVVVAPAHDGISGANVVSCVGALNPIDEAWLAAARLRFAQLAALPRPRTLLLLGGPTAQVRMDARWFHGLASILEQWLQRDGGALLVSSSRRTPAWLRGAVKRRFHGVAGVQWHAGATSDNPYAGFLAHADRIVVTPDSANLMSEAAATGLPVLAWAPRPVRGKLGILYRELLERGNLRPLRTQFQPWQAQPLRELPGVAARVRALLAEGGS